MSADPWALLLLVFVAEKVYVFNLNVLSCLMTAVSDSVFLFCGVLLCFIYCSYFEDVHAHLSQQCVI